jgi:putative heme-binding domain-containing protein
VVSPPTDHLESIKNMLKVLTNLLIVLFLSWSWTSTAVIASSEEDEMGPLASQGRILFQHYCAACHGVSGDGDGYNAEQLDKDPAELSDQKFIAKKNDSQIYRVIKFGGQGVKKSHLMPVFGHTLSEKEIWSLVAYIRHLADDEDHSVKLPTNTPETRPASPPPPHDPLNAFSDWYSKKGGDASLIAQGEKLFRKKKSCFACHQLNDEGGLLGPDLSRAGFSYTPEWIFTWLGNPQRIKPQSKMPNLGLDNQECRSITAFLASLKGEKLKAKWDAYLASPGDPVKGEKLFFDSEGKANCGKCHSVKGQGGKVGPQLGFVGTSRTQAFLLESILNPKAVITSGYSSILILTKKGKFITGVKRNEDDSSIDLMDKEGNALHISKDEIKKFKTQKISIMPGNFKDILTQDDIRHLLAYLVTLKTSN